MASASTPTTTPSRLLRLPLELFSSIASHLPNRDIKNLRLVCRAACSVAELRIPRVFLSANRLNVDVLHAIADHETYRKQVVEIVWDDARLLAPKVYTFGYATTVDPHPDQTWRSSCLHDQLEPNYQFSDGDCPQWFRDVCEDNIEIVRNRKRNDVDRPDHIARDQQIADRLPLKESWAYYQDLLRQQEEVLRSGADINALRRGLECFPALRRVTITPLAHGQLFTPLYETPMIRAFPRGFNYSIPRTWFVNEHQMIPFPRAWNLMNEAEKNQWRGVRIILRELVHVQGHHVDELVIDVVHLLSGFNCTIFAETCAEYNDFLALLRRPGFRRLDLALATPRQRYEEDWSAFRSGHLWRALAMARDMEHISLRTDDTNENYFGPDGNTDPHFIPLKTVFPIE
ncbi:hypothetical protein B0J18DRAFT_466753 [Chaetomium sp. MPI-SDFR-AT-0129]|nr:hypothetical protein B0J18DRAFT_466753 [Chaetomium sp. MPI-SDFR-AT-0129]